MHKSSVDYVAHLTSKAMAPSGAGFAIWFSIVNRFVEVVARRQPTLITFFRGAVAARTHSRISRHCVTAATHERLSSGMGHGGRGVQILGGARPESAMALWRL
jgi:hypothetical protein